MDYNRPAPGGVYLAGPRHRAQVAANVTSLGDANCRIPQRLFTTHLLSECVFWCTSCGHSFLLRNVTVKVRRDVLLAKPRNGSRAYDYFVTVLKYSFHVVSMSTVFIKFFQCTFIFTWVVLKCDTCVITQVGYKTKVVQSTLSLANAGMTFVFQYILALV